LPPGRGVTPSAGSTEARNDIRGCFGRSDRSAQGDRPTLRSIRPKRARRPAIGLLRSTGASNIAEAMRRNAARVGELFTKLGIF
jgi:hypothetical protein